VFVTGISPLRVYILSIKRQVDIPSESKEVLRARVTQLGLKVPVPAYHTTLKIEEIFQKQNSK